MTFGQWIVTLSLPGGVTLALAAGAALARRLRAGGRAAQAAGAAETGRGAGEGHLRDVLDSLAAFVAVLTPDGVVTEVNRAALERAGGRPREVLGQPFEQTPWWSHSDRARAQVRDAVARAARGEMLRYDANPRTVDGQPVIIDTMIAPVIDARGRVTHLVVSGIDVSGRRRAEQALRESEERFSLALQAAELGTWDLDVRTGRGVWSRTHFLLLGYEPPAEEAGAGEATFEMWRARLHPDDAAQVARSIEEAKQRGSLYNPEYRIIRADDGRVTWLSVSGRFRYDEAGNPARFTGVVRDVTRRRQADEEIARLNRDLGRRVGELQTLLEVLPVGIGIARDPDCRRLDVNPFFARVLGIPVGGNASLTAPDGERPTRFSVWADGRPLSPEALPLQAAAREGTVTRNLEVQIRRDDGRVIDLLEFVVPLRDESGRPCGAVGVFVDLTERRRAEDVARRQQEQLAHLSRVVTMGEMASGLAHELNQPLGAILNYAVACTSLLESSPPTGESGATARALAALHEVERETRRAGEIIRRLRSFVRKQAPRRVPVDVADLIADACRLMGSELRLQSVRLTIEAPPGLPKALADPVQIGQVLVNLIRNAVEAMVATDPARRRLDISAAAGTPGGGAGTPGAGAGGGAGDLRVCIGDTGPGVATGHERRIFDSFFTTRPDGLGIGLTISRSIVESHGGRLECEPGPGGGAVFRFTLPPSVPGPPRGSQP